MDALSLYLVTDRSLSKGRSLDFIVEEAVKGGVTMVQLREKDCSTREFYEQGVQLKALLKPMNVPLIINDRLDIALAIDADGLHIGQSDLPWSVARSILGGKKILGWSVETLEQIEEANQFDVDYIGISPVFATPTKTDTYKPFGLDGLREACRISLHPTVAIGGINMENINKVSNSGVDGVAVVSAISLAESPKEAALELKKELK